MTLGDLNIVSKIKVNKKNYSYFDLKKLSIIYPEINNLPFSIRILFEYVFPSLKNAPP